MIYYSSDYCLNVSDDVSNTTYLGLYIQFVAWPKHTFIFALLDYCGRNQDEEEKEDIVSIKFQHCCHNTITKPFDYAQ